MRFRKDYGYTPSQLKKIQDGKCVIRFCRRNRSQSRHRCSTCEKRKFKEANPEKNCYDNLKQNARKRGKEFDLTFDDFMIFLKRNPEYMIRKGRGALFLSIDRIRNHIGYTLKNIRSVTIRYNSMKRNYVDYPSKNMTQEEAKRFHGTPF